MGEGFCVPEFTLLAACKPGNWQLMEMNVKKKICFFILLLLA